MRSQENVNFIPSCRCGTSVQQGRGPCVPGAGSCGRESASFVPAAPLGRPAGVPFFLPSAPGAQVAANSFAS